MTEQQACTLCGAGGHTAANCIWNGSEKGLALAQRIDKNLAERAQFESWVRREWPGAPLHHVRDALPVSDPRYGEYCNENIQRGWVGWQARAALAQPSPAGEFGDAYQGAREDLAIWKRRALEAEQALREERILTERLGNALNDENGPTFMGEPNVTQPSPAPELDFAKPLETASGEPVKWVCSDVIEYKSARVCVDQNTGLVYSSPYIGLKIRNVMPAPELERPEAMTIAILQIDGWARQAGRDGRDTIAENYRRLAETLRIASSNYERIVGALRAELASKDEIMRAWQRAAERKNQIAADAQARVAELEKQEPVACMIRSRISHFRWDEEEQQSILWSEWAVATLTHGEAVTDPARNTPEVWQMKPLYAAPVAQAAQQPLKLSDDVREFLQEGINSVIGGEDADVDYEFANQLGKLLDPIYAAPVVPVAQAGQVLAGWRIEQAGDRIVVQQLPSGAGYAAAREGASGIAESVLFLLAADLLTGQVGQVPQAWLDVQAERRRQVEAEGWSQEHDDEHACDEIAAFACFYAMPSAAREWDASSTGYGNTLGEAILPEGWQPKTGDRRRELVKSGALILAEIERLDRAAGPAQGGRDE